MWVASVRVSYESDCWRFTTAWNEDAYKEDLCPVQYTSFVPHSFGPDAYIRDADRVRRRILLHADTVGLLLRPGLLRRELAGLAAMPAGDEGLVP